MRFNISSTTLTKAFPAAIAVFFGIAAHSGARLDFAVAALRTVSVDSTSNTVERICPGGKWKIVGPVRSYQVRDPQPVLGLQRGRSSNTTYEFDSSGRLFRATFELQAGAESMAALINTVEQSQGKYQARSEADSAGAKFEWAEAEGIEVSAAAIATMNIRPFLSITVRKMQPSKPTD